VSGIELRGPRVVLREFTLDDAPAVLEYHLDAEVMQFLPPAVRAPRNLDAVAALLDTTNRAAARAPRLEYDLAITIDENVVGAARLHRDAESSEAEIGYILGRDAWGTGIATETARLLVAFGFEALGLRRIRATVDEANIASIRVLEKVGLRRAGPIDPERQRTEQRNPSFAYLIER
jgi:RimJ/RimL family protein N-acetyltransferase